MTPFAEALRDLLRRYEERRRAGQHDGPPLRGLRLYRLQWQLDLWGRNRDQPNQRDLLFELLEPAA